MYPPREPNVRKNPDQYPDHEFRMAPHNKPSISFKHSRKLLAGSANQNLARTLVADQSDPPIELPSRLTGTLTTPTNSRQPDDDAGSSRD